MLETLQLVIGICVVIAVYLLTRRVNLWRMKKAFNFVVEDLEKKEATDPPSAIRLPYEKPRILSAGMRDFRPKALEYLTATEIVGRTEDGRYYLKNKNAGFLEP